MPDELAGHGAAAGQAPGLGRAGDPGNAGDAGGTTLEVLSCLWRDVLGIGRAVAGDADFFELGGHSLQAVQLTLEIFDVFGVEIRLHELLEEPTAECMARLIDERASAPAAAVADDSAGVFAELSPDQLQGLFDDA